MSQGFPEHLTELFDTRRRNALRLAACFGILSSVTTWLLGNVVGLARDPWPLGLAAATSGFIAAALGFGMGSRSVTKPGEYGSLALGTMGAGAITGILFAVAMKISTDRAGGFLAAGSLALFGSLFGVMTALAFFAGPLAIVYRSHVSLARARSGSLVDRVNRQRVWFTTFIIVFAAMALPIQLDHQADRARSMFLAIAEIALCFTFFMNVLRTVRFLLASRGLAPSPGGIVDLAANEADLGVGEDCNVQTTVPPNPYRSLPRVTTVLRGSILTTRRILFSILRFDGAVVVLALVASLHPFADKPLTKPPASEAVTPKPGPPAPFRQLSFYPQQTPILVDVDSDGVEDVIGLSWDPGHTDEALDAVAVSGTTMRPLWRSPAIRSQWSSPRTRLVMSGDSLFLTDSEGLLHIISVRDGSEHVTRSSPISGEAPRTMCPAPNAPPRVWMAEEQQSPKQMGITVYADGSQTEDERFEWCTSAPYPRCDEQHASTCSNSRVVEWRDGLAYSALEENGLGFAVGSSRGDAPRSMELVGYDVTTRKNRFEIPVSFDAGALHTDPRIGNALRGGRIFTFYQRQNGRWILGARDARSGSTLWFQEASSTDRGTDFKSLFASPTRLYAMIDWHVRVFDAQTGAALGTMF